TMFGMVGCGAITRKGRPLASRKRVTWAAASVVSPGGFGLFARTKSHRNLTILSRSSAIQAASCFLTSVMAWLLRRAEWQGHTPTAPGQVKALATRFGPHGA